MLLLRYESSDQGTFGFLIFGGEHIHTLELPWRNNQPNISCIPRGTYEMRMRVSPKYKECYEITGVEGRSHILLHHGNFAADRSLGLRTNSAGCVLLGTRRGVLYGQKAVLSSRIARTRFESAMKWENTAIEIVDDFSG